MSVYKRLEALNIALPKLTPPVAAFVPFLRSVNLIFLAGTLPNSTASHGSVSRVQI